MNPQFEPIDIHEAFSSKAEVKVLPEDYRDPAPGWPKWLLPTVIGIGVVVAVQQLQLAAIRRELRAYKKKVPVSSTEAKPASRSQGVIKK